ncbi:hypothetical protein AAFF_G00254570 [Aldrovandia affinis]|uniref:Paraneoplastic antigen Ma-like C-terminal domain-containing protein n=1 Tax=Aldrovandia affinis TaxID=143900 RepID=A0AAD7W373_9TELE|nr:hypothetical protein AAFF_G00254570 [Aldrovandia affinis]
MPDLQKSLKICESLLPPASDVIKRLGPGAVAVSYIQLLDAAYDTVEDGDELMAKFINTLQDSGEKTSTYLHRLQAVLNQAEKGVCKPSSHGYQAMLKILEARRKHTDTGTLGWVKMQGPNSGVIPAGHTVVIDAFVHVNGTTFLYPTC